MGDQGVAPWKEQKYPVSTEGEAGNVVRRNQPPAESWQKKKKDKSQPPYGSCANSGAGDLWGLKKNLGPRWELGEKRGGGLGRVSKD